MLPHSLIDPTSVDPFVSLGRSLFSDDPVFKLSLLWYFRSPFPSTKGFSAYRMPGVAVHGPLIFAFSVLGFLLCWPHPMLQPLVAAWMLAGLYLGRDLTVLCHYNPLLTIICWAGSAIVLLRPAPIARFGASHIVIPAMLSVAVIAVLFLVALVMTREKDSCQ
jgi:hypothetical protein